MASPKTPRKKDTHRKLTAILCADVVGYSRLMGADEEATIETLTAYRKVFTSEIKKHRGRVVDAKGDAILAEFASVVDAVNGAVEIQRELAEKNTEFSDDRRMDFRIGINLGDVVVKDDVIYGDGVNVAARLESLAEPGGICISRPVHDQVRAKVDLEYDYLGEHKVKNIAEPVRVYKVLLKPGQAPTRLRQAARTLARSKRKIALGVVAAVVVALVAVVGWNYYQQRTAAAALAVFEQEVDYPLPEKPSIAILAFENMSGDPEQEYFGDSLSENIITGLAGVDDLFVIARNSSFKYKGKSVDVRQIGRELGVRYVLEGTVQKAEKRVRVTAQLIDAATGHHLWAGRYDQELVDFFALQDEITRNIMGELLGKLIWGESSRGIVSSTKNLDALAALYRADKHFKRWGKKDMLLAREWTLKAIALDPNFPQAYSALAWSYILPVFFGYSDSPGEDLLQGGEHAKKALALSSGKSGLAPLGYIQMIKKEHTQAIATFEKAVAVRPSDARFHAFLSRSLDFNGQPAEAIKEMKIAMRLAPFYPEWWLSALALTYFNNTQYEKAVEACLNLRKRGSSRTWWLRTIIASYMALGKEAEARAEVKKYLVAEPDASLATTRKYFKPWPYREFSWLDRMNEFLRKAGLPD